MDQATGVLDAAATTLPSARIDWVAAVDAERIPEVASALLATDEVDLYALRHADARKQDVPGHWSLVQVRGAVAASVEGFVVPDLGGRDNGCDGSGESVDLGGG